ncbi:MAG TPA: SDR family oxidoreductase [Glycomyces sp.]|nr:SDR family oxidoreductase [Glycomyces sp.]
MGTALITGATSGIGLELAWQLAAARHDLVLVARSSERLERRAEEIRAAAGVRVEVLAADLGTTEGRGAVVERLRQQSAPVGLLVNNAGFGLGQRLVGGDLSREELALEVMVRAVLELSKTAAEEMVPRRRGAILNVASIAGLTAMGTYSAHKAWVRTFSESLASELQGTGVTVTALCPGLVRTEFHDSAGMDDSVWPSISWLAAESVAAAGLRAVRRGQVLCTPSVRYAALAAGLRAAPRFLVRRFAGADHYARAVV